MSGPSAPTNATVLRKKINIEWMLSGRLSFVALLAAITFYYLFLLSNGNFQLFAPELLDQAYNNMLMHLLHGEFTVDRDAIGFEAFTRDGRCYSYFGIFPAVLRFFAIPFADIARAHLARLSCLTAVVIFVALQLRALLIVQNSLPMAKRRSDFLAVTVLATVLSGPQLYILAAASIYHEPLLWAAAIASGFNLMLVKVAFEGGRLHPPQLALLGGYAALALNARVSIGVALYLITLMLVVWSAWGEYIRRSDGWHWQVISRLVPSVIVLILGVLVAGVINYGRWGNPLTFVDFRYYDMRATAYQSLPNILEKYGEFNFGRMWIGALYYATGVPYILKTVSPFAEFLHARIMLMEPPPVTPILTNPLTIFLAGVGLCRICWKPQLTNSGVAILGVGLLGHAATVFLILAAMALTLRYRVDFAPFVTLAALIGYRSLSLTVGDAGPAGEKWVEARPIFMCILGILSSHYVLLLFKVASFAVPMNVRLALLPLAPFAKHAFQH
jgi:hypothetical protein